MNVFQIDLQWMVMACDPDSVKRELCDELPMSDSGTKLGNTTIYQTSQFQMRKPAEPQCEVTCPAGPPGRNGTRVTTRT